MCLDGALDACVLYDKAGCGMILQKNEQQRLCEYLIIYIFALGKS